MTYLTTVPRAVMAGDVPSVALREKFARKPISDRSATCPATPLLRAMAARHSLCELLPATIIQAMASELLAHRALDLLQQRRQRAIDNIDIIARVVYRHFDITGSPAHGLKTDTIAAVLADELAAGGYGAITLRDIHAVLDHWHADPMTRVWLDTTGPAPILRGIRVAGQ